MSWNYRVTRTRVDLAGETAMHYAIREVYYDAAGEPRSWTVEVIGARGDSAQECRDDHALMAEAFTKPVLDITDEANPFEVEEPTKEPAEGLST